MLLYTRHQEINQDILSGNPRRDKRFPPFIQPIAYNPSPTARVKVRVRVKAKVKARVKVKVKVKVRVKVRVKVKVKVRVKTISNYLG
jgi:hypothetical protein